MLRALLLEAPQMLAAGGEVHITLVHRYPYTSWLLGLTTAWDGGAPDAANRLAKKRKKRSAAPDPAKPGGESVMLASELFSPNALVGTGTADGDAEDDGAPPGVADGQEQPVRIDFSVLDEGERQGDLRRLEQETEAELQELRRRQESMAPNMKAPQQFDEVSGRLASAENDFKALSSNTKNIRERADSVRKERKQRFLAAFEHIAHVIDGALLHVHALDVVLRELGDDQLSVAGDVPLRRLDLAGDELEEGGFACAVGPHNRDAALAIESEVALAVERHVRDGAVGQGVGKGDVLHGDARRREGRR